MRIGKNLDPYTKNRQYQTKMEQLKYDFFKRSRHYDETPAFPHENFDQIVQMKLHTLNLSPNYGGYNFGIESTCNFLIEIASVCPSTALCLAMHYYSLGGFKSILTKDLKEELFKDYLGKWALYCINK